MSRHTPGPWKVSQIVSNSEIKPRSRNYAGSEAYVWTDRKYPKGVCIATVREHYQGEVEANAHLIAAAPEMLATLDSVLNLLHDDNSTLADFNELQNEIERVIGRAALGDS